MRKLGGKIKKTKGKPPNQNWPRGQFRGDNFPSVVSPSSFRNQPLLSLRFIHDQQPISLASPLHQHRRPPTSLSPSPAASFFLSLSLSSSWPSMNHRLRGSADDTCRPAKFRGCRCGGLQLASHWDAVFCTLRRTCSSDHESGKGWQSPVSFGGQPWYQTAQHTPLFKMVLFVSDESVRIVGTHFCVEQQTLPIDLSQTEPYFEVTISNSYSWRKMLSNII